jgi:hypothetical protein
VNETEITLHRFYYTGGTPLTLCSDQPYPVRKIRALLNLPRHKRPRRVLCQKCCVLGAEMERRRLQLVQRIMEQPDDEDDLPGGGVA